MATKNEIRPPMLAAGNPAPAPVDLRPAQNSGWGDETYTLPGSGSGITYDQVQQEEKKTQPPQTPTNKVRVPLRDTKPTTPGGVNLNMPRNPDAERQGVAAGSTEALKYDKLIDALYKEREEADADAAKRERRNALFAAIGDGVSALSNLYFTTKGAPSASDSKTLSKATDELAEKNKKEREDRFNRRMAMLKDQREQGYKLHDQRLREDRERRLAQYQQDRIDAYYKRLENERKAKEAEAERRRLKDEADQRNKEAEQKRKQQETDSKVKDYEDKMAKRKNNNVPAGGTTGKSSTSKNKKTNKKKTPKGKTPKTPTYNNLRKLGL